MTTRGTQQARQFLAAVEAACADLDPADRARLVGGLEEHLAELSADGVDLVAELGDPVAYAHELRSAAGLPTGSRPAVPASVAASAPGSGGWPADGADGASGGPPTRGLPLGPTTASLPVQPEPSPNVAKVLLVIGGVLAFIAVLVTAALVFGLAFFSTSSSESRAVPSVATPAEIDVVVVPDLTGTDREQALRILSEFGLAPQIVNEPSSSVRADVVIGQDPAAGTSVAAGSAVRLTVSTAP